MSKKNQKHKVRPDNGYPLPKRTVLYSHKKQRDQKLELDYSKMVRLNYMKGMNSHSHQILI